MGRKVKKYYINGIIANAQDLDRLYFDYFSKFVEIEKITKTPQAVYIFTN